MGFKKIAYVLSLLAALITLGIGFYTMEAFSSAGLIMLILAITPYFIMSFVISKSQHSLSIIVNTWLTIFLTLLGTATLAYEMFIHKDAQSALSFVVIPVYQFFTFAIISFVVSLVVRHKR